MSTLMRKGSLIKYDTKEKKENSFRADLAEKQIFRGFLTGTAFITKKGYKGTKLDSLWVRQIFDAFENDDVELVEIALKSVLADYDDRVLGGECGAPFLIGDFGFYASNQFKRQEQFLQLCEETNAPGHMFLSRRQWNEINEKLAVLANHGTARFYKAVRGDSFASLAVGHFIYFLCIYVLSIHL